MNGSTPHALDPHHFGFLTEQPEINTGTHELFPGEERLLSTSMRRRKRELLDALGPHLDRFLEADEKILYVAAAMQIPTLFEQLGLGWWFYRLHRTALVLTDRRLIEVLLDARGKRATTRIRAFAWNGLVKAKQGLRSFRVVPEGGKATSWRVAHRADRKVIKLLLERIRTHVPKVTGTPESVVRWHCPECGSGNRPDPAHCVHCGTRFRSAGLATVLSLAIPGGGLFYAGRPVLGAFDLLGELFLFAVVAIPMLAAASLAEGLAVATVGLFFLALTKLESVHLSRILVRRSLPETEGFRRGWKRAGAAGGVLSGLALVATLAATGTLAAHLERDLTFAAGEAWHQTRSPEEFLVDDADQRSQWSHPDGTTVIVSAYTLGVGEDWSGFRSDYLSLIGTDGTQPLLVDEQVPEGFTGFRCFFPVEDDDGARYVALNYMLYDDQSDAVHHVYTFTETDWLDSTAVRMAELVDAAAWTAVDGPSL